MQQPELEPIRGIGDTGADRPAPDHVIETVAASARPGDAEVDELRQSPQSARSQVREGEVARCRHQARRVVTEEEAVADEPLATFVVEARRPGSESDDQPHFVVHHVEAGETLATSVPRPTIDDAMRWMQERVTMPAGQLATQPPAERQEVAPVSAPEQPTPPASPRGARRGRLQITGLEVRLAEHINGAAVPLLASTPVAIEAGGALVFAADVSLEGADHPVTCEMRCRLHRIESQDEIEFTWSSETNVTPGMPSTTTSSSPVPIPAGAYRGEFFAEDRGNGVSRAFRQLPLLIVI